MDLDAAKKHIILLKLEGLLEKPAYPMGEVAVLGVPPSRQWLASAGALLRHYDPRLGKEFDSYVRNARNISLNLFQSVQPLMVDAVERIKLDLELDGRNEIGTAYGPNEVYRYFVDLKQIVGGATKELFVVDPYFNGRAFDNYLGEVSGNVSIRLLAERYAKEVTKFAAKHRQEFGTEIEIRKSSELHDRLVIVDRADCWISGGSIKDGGQKPTYLIPLASSVAEKKLHIYEQIWSRSKPIELADPPAPTRSGSLARSEIKPAATA